MQPQMMNNGVPAGTLPPEPVPRVKSKQHYEWYQDNKQVKLRIPMKGITMKKIDVFVSDLVLKINIQEKKWVRIIDLQHPVQFLSTENSVVYANETLEIALMKEEPSLVWTDLVFVDEDKQVIKDRRQESFARRELAEHQHIKQRNDLKIQYDSHATKEMMRLEDQSRKVLETAKTNEKNEALRDIYKDVDDEGNFEADIGTEEQQISASSATVALVESAKPQKIEHQPQIIWTHKYDDSIFSEDISSDMFGEQDLVEEYREKPKVRDQKKIDLGFTQRIYPGVAAREQHFKEPPMPKIKPNGAEQQTADDVENKNPLWIKDRGDEFYKNSDYYSAIMAYNQALKLDENMIVCIANRCACNVQLFNYEEVLGDADRLLARIENLKQEERETPNIQSMRVKMLLRKGIACSWKGDIAKSLKVLESTISADVELLKQLNIIEQFNDALARVKKREESIAVKKHGDQQFKNGNYEEALKKYEESVSIDMNETAMGNISLTYLKLEKFAECIEFCDRSIKKVQNFTRFANFNSLNRSSAHDSNSFLVKLYLRKAKAQQLSNELDQAFSTVKQAIQINDQNSEAKEIFKSIEKSFLLKEVASLKAEAASLIKENRVREALEVYGECMKKIDSSTETLEYLAILLNRCTCFLKIEQFEDIISTCLRGLKIIRSFKNRVISWTSAKLSKEDKEKLVQFEARFLVRRANAYLKQNLIYNAKTDLDEALKLDPTNLQLKADVEKIRATIR